MTGERCSENAKDGDDAERVSRFAPGFGDDMTGRDGLLLESERGCAAAGWLLCVSEMVSPRRSVLRMSMLDPRLVAPSVAYLREEE